MMWDKLLIGAFLAIGTHVLKHKGHKDPRRPPQRVADEGGTWALERYATHRVVRDVFIEPIETQRPQGSHRSLTAKIAKEHRKGHRRIDPSHHRNCPQITQMDADSIAPPHELPQIAQITTDKTITDKSIADSVAPLRKNRVENPMNQNGSNAETISTHALKASQRSADAWIQV